MFCKVDFLSTTCAKVSFAYIPRDGISNAPKSGDFLHPCKKKKKQFVVSFEADWIVSKLKILKSLGGSAPCYRNKVHSCVSSSPFFKKAQLLL